MIIIYIVCVFVGFALSIFIYEQGRKQGKKESDCKWQEYLRRLNRFKQS